MTRPAHYPVAGYVVRDQTGAVIRSAKLIDRPADNAIHTFDARPVVDFDVLSRLAAIADQKAARA